MKRRVYLVVCTCAISLLAGCAGYRLGNEGPAGIQTVSLAPVINKTNEPAMELQVTHALRERIQFDGRLKLANANDAADGIIEVTLTQYDLTPIAYRDQRRTTPQLYRLRIKGKAVLKRSDTGQVIATSDTYGDATVPFQSDLTSAKRDALPVATAEIAKYMLDDLIEQW